MSIELKYNEVFIQRILWPPSGRMMLVHGIPGAFIKERDAKIGFASGAANVAVYYCRVVLAGIFDETIPLLPCFNFSGFALDRIQ